MNAVSSSKPVLTDIRIEAAGWSDVVTSLEGLCASAIEAAVSRVNTRGGEVAVLFTDNAEMQRLNRLWRGKDTPTDVLSFPAPAGVGGAINLLGDIALGLETCVADAAAMVREMDFHVSHLVVHGFLHLLGYDHVVLAEAEIMEQLEIQILSDLGWPDPYTLVEIGAERA